MAEEKRDFSKRASKERLKQLKGHKNNGRNARRILKYGTQSFRRNNWLSVAAIIIMVITLVIISATLIATHVMSVTMDEFREKVDMSIYIKQDATEKEIDKITKRLKKLESVEAVSVVAPNSANEQTIEQIINTENITDDALKEAIKNAPNKLPWTLNVKIKDLNDTGELENFVYNDSSMKDMLDSRPPTFSSKHRDTINRIGHVMQIVRNSGFVATAIFATVSIIIIYNTIRMAIFNRREEIYMMKLVGADSGFIRGPFLVEAALYGLIAAIIAIVLVIVILALLDGKLPVSLTPTIELLRANGVLYAIALIFCGVLIGIISALLATRKYLKIQ